MDSLVDLVRQKQERIEELRREISELESELDTVAVALGGRVVVTQAKVGKPKSRHGFTNGKRAKPIKEFSSVWWAQLILTGEANPLPIDELVAKINEHSDKPVKKATLVSNLSRYVIHGDTFTRPAPNTFGLVKRAEKPSE